MKKNIQRLLPNLTEEQYALDFKNLNIDSIDLVTLRVDIEQGLGRIIPNKDWLAFRTLNDILSYCETAMPTSTTETLNSVERKADRENFINMPQMCIEGLSENWLFKEAGSLHWDLLCSGLSTSSSELKDDLGNRLYATFVRIRIDCSKSLGNFKENQPYAFNADLSRFGLGMFFSKILFSSLEDTIKIDMMTSFSIRKSAGDNKSLAKSQPSVDNCNIRQNSELPIFGNEYRLLKKGDLKTFFYEDYIFNITDDELFKHEYCLNPYYDLNGVGLLYFAAYPVINDYCELQYFLAKGEENWESKYYTIFRDIMYYANCDSRDSMQYVLNSVEYMSENRIKICSTLYRKSDSSIMARIFTVKKLNLS